jgi:hypothetical protein
VNPVPEEDGGNSDKDDDDTTQSRRIDADSFEDANE